MIATELATGKSLEPADMESCSAEIVLGLSLNRDRNHSEPFGSIKFLPLLVERAGVRGIVGQFDA
jgi:hypothetical protein